MFLSCWLLLIVNPSETLLVIESMTGKEAAKLAVYFDSAVDITGESFTILDGDSRGGAADSL